MRDKIKWLWKYYRRHPYALSVLVFLTPVQAMLNVAIPQFFGFSVDYLNTSVVTESWMAQWVTGTGESAGLSVMASYGVTFILLGLAASILYAFVQCHRAWMNVRLEWEFRQDSFDGLTEKGPDFFNKFRTGDIVTRLTDDVAEKLSWFACSGIFRLWEAMLFIVFIVVMMINIDPWLTLWTAGPLPILVFIFSKSSAALDRRYDRLQTRISLFNNIATVPPEPANPATTSFNEQSPRFGWRMIETCGNRSLSRRADWPVAP